ncbi:MAG: hypothetical protein OEW59_07745, partial [Gammaproteobacteria bacterium]|nr:hypothetical protein [Gammaproteobacteria bacterium]
MAAAEISHRMQDDQRLSLAFTGDWLLDANLPSVEPALQVLTGTPKPVSIAIDASGLGDWDTGLVAALVRLRRPAEAHGVT